MTQRIDIRYLLIALVIFEMLFMYSINAKAHCDTLDGPVVESARHALAAGDVTPLLKWVSIDDEPLIRTAFQKLRHRMLNTQCLHAAAVGFIRLNQ